MTISKNHLLLTSFIDFPELHLSVRWEWFEFVKMLLSHTMRVNHQHRHQICKFKQSIKQWCSCIHSTSLSTRWCLWLKLPMFHIMCCHISDLHKSTCFTRWLNAVICNDWHEYGMWGYIKIWWILGVYNKIRLNLLLYKIVIFCQIVHISSDFKIFVPWCTTFSINI